MKFTLERSDALHALTRVTGVVSRSSIPILNNVLIETQDGGIRLRATDLDMEATTNCPARVETQGAITVDAAKLKEVVAASAPGSEISFELSTDDDPRMIVKSGRSRFKLAVMSADQFPAIPDDAWAVTFDMPCEVLSDALTRTVFAVGSDMAMPSLHGVFLEIRDGNIVAVATNRYRVSRIIGTAPKGTDDMPSVILPTKYVGQTIKALGETGDATVSISKNKVRVVVNGATLTGKTIDYDYVDYARLIPAEYDNIARVDKATFAAACRRAAIAGDVDKNGTGIRLAFTNGTLTITGRNHDGEAMDEIEADYDGPDFMVGSGVQYILDAIANVEGETVSVGLGEKLPVVVFWSDTDDASLQIVGKRLVGHQ
jgi:DNA polymerase III subunit beta